MSIDQPKNGDAPFHVSVITMDLETGVAEKRMVIDYSNYNHRKWLAKHSWWAFSAGKMITTCATSDPVTFIERGEVSGG